MRIFTFMRPLYSLMPS